MTFYNIYKKERKAVDDRIKHSIRILNYMNLLMDNEIKMEDIPKEYQPFLNCVLPPLGKQYIEKLKELHNDIERQDALKLFDLILERDYLLCNEDDTIHKNCELCNSLDRELSKFNEDLQNEFISTLKIKYNKEKIENEYNRTKSN